MQKYIVLILILTSTIFASIDSNSTKEYIINIELSNNLEKSSVAKAIGVKEKDIFNFWSRKLVITKEFVSNIKPTLKGYLESKGYFDSKIYLNILANSVNLKIDEGEPIRVKDIKVSSDFNIKNFISWKQNSIFSSEEFEKIKDNIVKKLLESGYCNYKLDTKAYVDLKEHSAKLAYTLEKKDLCYFGDINITKRPKDINEDVILSRLKYKKGDIFNISKIEDSYSSLNTLNTFANLQILYDLDKRSREVSTTLKVDKRDKLRRYLVSLGVDSEIGLIAL